jgi:hypothetical protein
MVSGVCRWHRYLGRQVYEVHYGFWMFGFYRYLAGKQKKSLVRFFESYGSSVLSRMAR